MKHSYKQIDNKAENMNACVPITTSIDPLFISIYICSFSLVVINFDNSLTVIPKELNLLEILINQKI